VGVGIDGDAVAAQVLGAVHGAVDALVEVVEVVVCDDGDRALGLALAQGGEGVVDALGAGIRLVDDGQGAFGIPCVFPFDLAAMK
jgi:hypothetical protein